MLRPRPPARPRFSLPSLVSTTASSDRFRSGAICSSEWTDDLMVSGLAAPAMTPNSLAAAGYVDFDVVESVHVTAGPEAAPPR